MVTNKKCPICGKDVLTGRVYCSGCLDKILRRDRDNNNIFKRIVHKLFNSRK